MMSSLFCALEDEFGKAARELHRGLTSSDIVDTAFALQLKKAGTYLGNQLRVLIHALWDQALESQGTVPGAYSRTSRAADNFWY